MLWPRRLAGVALGVSASAGVASCLFPSLDDLTGAAASDASAPDAPSEAPPDAPPSASDGGVAVRTFPAVADAWVRGGSSVNTNNGDNPKLFAVSLDPNGAERRIYLKFEVTGLAGAAVRSATLKLSCVSGSNHGGELHLVTDTTWAEDGITWQSQPAFGPVFAARAEPITARATAEIDVTSAVHEGTISFALTSPSADEVQYSSREGDAGAPELVVTF